MFCFHKYGKVQKDGYQYCIKCGKARPLKCPHNWIDYERISILDEWANPTPIGINIVLKCSKCGDMKTFKI